MLFLRTVSKGEVTWCCGRLGVEEEEEEEEERPMWATARAVASSAGRARLVLGGQGVRAKHSNRAAKRFKKPQFGVSVEVRPLQFPPEEWQAKKVRWVEVRVERSGAREGC